MTEDDATATRRLSDPSPDEGAARRALLTVLSDEEPRRVVPIPANRAVTLGRSLKATIRFEDSDMSRIHASLQWAEGEVVVRDLDSTNGTYVNEERVAFVGLNDGDIVRLGKRTIIQFTLFSSDEEGARPWEKTIQTDELTARLTAHAEARDEREEDLLEAQAFQKRALAEAPAVSGVDIDVLYRPRDRIGGDVYNLTMVDGRLLGLIADTTGHGVKAALTTMLVLSEWQDIRQTEGSVADRLALLNRRICNNYMYLELRFTAMVFELGPETGWLSYATAAHPAPLVVGLDGTRELETGGTFVGLVSDVTYPQWDETLRRGEAFFSMTDGLSEQMRNGEMFDYRAMLGRLAPGPR
ncbi:MAG: SpoIIE family protein phosphatase, partial [Myxococcota bacterium]